MTSIRCAAHGTRAHGPLEALFHIFVLPYRDVQRIVSRRSFQTLSRPLRASQLGLVQQAHLLPRTQRRFRGSTKSKYKNQPTIHNNDKVRDEAIGTSHINLVAPDGTYYPGQPLRQILQTFDRRTHTLQLVMEGKSHLPPDDKDHYPTCKIFNKQDLLQDQRKHEKQVIENFKRNKKLETGGKTMELSWSIGENDLTHRFKRLREFLEEGRRVDVVLAKKKGSREVSEKECLRLVDRIEGELEEIPGARERKEAEGKAGLTMTLYWQGNQIEKVDRKPDS